MSWRGPSEVTCVSAWDVPAGRAGTRASFLLRRLCCLGDTAGPGDEPWEPQVRFPLSDQSTSPPLLTRGEALWKLPGGFGFDGASLPARAGLSHRRLPTDCVLSLHAALRRPTGLPWPPGEKRVMSTWGGRLGDRLSPGDTAKPPDGPSGVTPSTPASLRRASPSRGGEGSRWGPAPPRAGESAEHPWAPWGSQDRAAVPWGGRSGTPRIMKTTRTWSGHAAPRPSVGKDAFLAPKGQVSMSD